jgi:hypothetical protein
MLSHPAVLADPRQAHGRPEGHAIDALNINRIMIK